LPGDEDTDADAIAATDTGPPPPNCLLDVLEERFMCNDEDIDSVSALFESRIKWRRDSWTTVRLVAASLYFPVGSKLRSCFPLSKILRNSEILSSSVCSEPPGLAAIGSASKPEPGCATDDARLCRPLLPPCSSSGALLLAPLKDRRPRRCVKLLLYRLVGVGRGELASAAVSADVAVVDGGGIPRSDAGIPAVNDDRFLG
jgi:hypothetical protein